MTWRSHALLGADTVWLLAALPHASDTNIGLLAALAAFGALLPDIDASESKIRHLISVCSIEPFSILGDVVHLALGHRGFLHSMAGLLFIAGLTSGLTIYIHVGWLAGTAMCSGYASHLVADGCTPAGIPLWYPNRRRVHLLPRPLRITTGSLAEDALLPFLAFPILLLLLRSLIVPS